MATCECKQAFDWRHHRHLPPLYRPVRPPSEFARRVTLLFHRLTSPVRMFTCRNSNPLKMWNQKVGAALADHFNEQGGGAVLLGSFARAIGTSWLTCCCYYSIWP
jgi:hypothetical protein